MSCGGSCWGACGHWNGWHFILRLVLGIVILVIVFWGGFKLGLIIGSSGNGYGYGYGMHGYRMGDMMRGYWNGYYGPGMIYGWNSTQEPVPTNPTPAK